MEIVSMIIVLYICLELFEAQWQKADSMLGILVRLHRYYRRSIFLFLALHPTYYFAIWLILRTDLSVPAVLLLFIKTLDIATKIVLMQQVFDKKEVSMQLHEMLMMPLEKWMPHIGLAVYPPLVIWALL